MDGNFYIFQDGGHRRLGLSKFQFFNGQNGQEGRTASLPDFVEIVRTAAEICEFQYYASLA